MNLMTLCNSPLSAVSHDLLRHIPEQIEAHAPTP